MNTCKPPFSLVLEWTVRCSWTVRFFVMFDMFEVRFWAKMWCSEVFEVRSCCYVTRLVLELTVWCSRTVLVFVMFDMFEVRFWAKMWCLDIQCSECSKFGILVFVPRLVIFKKLLIILFFRCQLFLNINPASSILKPMLLQKDEKKKSRRFANNVVNFFWQAYSKHSSLPLPTVMNWTRFVIREKKD